MLMDTILPLAQAAGSLIGDHGLAVAGAGIGMWSEGMKVRVEGK